VNETVAAGAPRAACVAVGLGLAALTLPFDARWLDFEATRRALACILATLGALAWFVGRRPVPIRGLPWLALLCAWALIRTIDVTNGGEARLRAAYWWALAAAVFVGAGLTRRQLVTALLPTALFVAVYGIAQGCGLVFPEGYARAGEAPSTLGNRNVAAECTLLAFACAAHGIAADTRWRGLGLALPVLGLALGTNGTRAALVAIPIVVGIAWWRAAATARGARRAWLACGVIAVLTGLSLRALDGPEAPVPAAATAGTGPILAPSTIDVRLALWSGVLAMIGDAPLAGHGTGQLRFEYPRYRTQAEIEASTFGRQFPTVVDSAHDDPLELTAELGLIGAALLVALLVAALRSRPLLEILPLLAFGVVALFRAPLGNAPAAVVAALWLGTLARREGHLRALTLRVIAGLTALGGCVLAGPPLLAAADLAAWLRDGEPKHLDAAIARHPSEPRYRSLRVRARCGGIEADGTLVRRGAAEFDANRDDLDALQRLDPHNTESLWLLAQLAHGAGQVELTRAALARILGLDPREPRAQLLAAVLLFEAGRHREAAATLYADPHPRLRARLADTFAGLAAAPALADDAAARALYGRERAFVRAVDLLVLGPASAEARAAAEAFARSAAPDDPRARVVLARALLAAGKPQAADELATGTLDLRGSERAMLAPLFAALRERPAWANAWRGRD
jgi:hypothetical protein